MKNKNIINLTIDKDGYNKFDGNLFDLNEEKINKSFDLNYSDPKYRNNNYENVAILNHEDIKKTVYNEILGKIYSILNFNNLNYVFQSLWLQNSNSEYSNLNINELPFIPHIDKRRCLKVMIYLNEINKRSGPINLTKTKPENFEKIRKNLSIDYQAKKENVIHSIPIEKYTSCDGSFGTSIFFDTNTPHFAGQISDVKAFRKILRFTLTKPENKFYNIAKSIKKVFFN